MIHIRLYTGRLMLMLLLAASSRLHAAAQPSLPSPVTRVVEYEKDIQPIFAHSCYSCHGEQKQKNGYRLDLKGVALTGGDHHAPNIIPGKSAESPLIQFVAGLDKEIVMPAKGDRLTTEQISLLRAWIDQGAKWPERWDKRLAEKSDWWSLKPLHRVPVPMIRNSKWPVRNPIDSFVLTRLEQKGLRPSPPADRRTLIRRLYFDLIGLPPTPDKVEAFVA